MIDNKLILIVSIDLSELVANPFSQIYELNEASTHQVRQPLSYLSFDKLPHPQHITSVNLSEISSQASWYNNDLDLDANTSKLSHQHHISISNVDMKENFKFDSTLTLKSQQTKHFFLNPEEWSRIKPKIGCSNKLLPNWTNIFNQKLSSLNPYCVFKFLYHRINSQSETRNCPFIIAQAICKFEKCVKFSIWIDKVPKGKFDHVSVDVLTEGILSDKHFDHTTSHSRNVSNDNREELGKMLTCSSASINIMIYLKILIF